MYATDQAIMSPCTPPQFSPLISALILRLPPLFPSPKLLLGYLLMYTHILYIRYTVSIYHTPSLLTVTAVTIPKTCKNGEYKQLLYSTCTILCVYCMGVSVGKSLNNDSVPRSILCMRVFFSSPAGAALTVFFSVSSRQLNISWAVNSSTWPDIVVRSFLHFLQYCIIAMFNLLHLL